MLVIFHIKSQQQEESNSPTPIMVCHSDYHCVWNTHATYRCWFPPPPESMPAGTSRLCGMYIEYHLSYFKVAAGAGRGMEGYIVVTTCAISIFKADIALQYILHCFPSHKHWKMNSVEHVLVWIGNSGILASLKMTSIIRQILIIYRIMHCLF